MNRQNIVILILVIHILVMIPPVIAATTELHIVKYANDGTTILNQTTKNYTWLAANLPVQGDGVTHYYSQGPTFNATDLWDNAEWQNIVPDRDWGAVKGTDLKDICNLVGGMSTGETVKILASDSFYKIFPYEYIYTPNPRQGPMVITWYRSEDGYVPNYSSGMRLLMFADAKTNTYGWNTSGWHVFGNADMRDSWAPDYWYNYSGIWPSSGGTSVKFVSDVYIYSNQAPPQAAEWAVGVFRGNRDWYLDSSGNGAWGSGDTIYGFGIAGDKPVAGDWNRDGKTEIGVFRGPRNWYLDTSGDGAWELGDTSYGFGIAGDIPVTGDWNRDGKTEIGIFRGPRNWYLDTSGDGAWGPGDTSYGFGLTGDKPVMGDWNSDGKTEIGVFRDSHSWYLDTSGNGAWGGGDSAYGFGIAGDLPVTGKWS